MNKTIGFFNTDSIILDFIPRNAIQNLFRISITLTTNMRHNLNV
ncbi:hypothetical protein [Helicobacter bilis]|nr:hypothetical protein [Helicobacter bilis]